MLILNKLEDTVRSLSYSHYEPTITIFDKNIVVNYKKTGTRFFHTLSTLPNSIDDNMPDIASTQIDINFIREDGTLDSKFGFFMDSVPYNINLKLNNKDIIWQTNDEFFDYNNVSTISEFFKENNKKFTFVIKNPLDRFLSGVVQIVIPFIAESLKDIKERTLLKNITNISDSEIDYIIIRSNDIFSEQYHKRLVLDNENTSGFDILEKIIKYIIEYRWDLILQDIHTEHYLTNVKKLITEIGKDTTKIINLEDCNYLKAYSYFDTFSNNIKYSEYFDQLTEKKNSNTYLYNFIKKMYNDDTSIFEAVPHYLKKEYSEYIDLKKSKYFLDLSNNSPL